MGGIEALRGVKTIVARQRVNNITPYTSTDAQSTSYIQYPDHFRVEAGAGDSLMVTGFDGTAAWTRDARRTLEVPREAAAEAQSNLDRDVIRLLIAGKDGAMDVRRLPDGSLEFSGRGMSAVVLTIDPVSNRVTKESFAGGRGGQALIDESFSDYRAVDGVQMPFAAERRIGPISIKRRVIELHINQPIDPALFTRPAS
jgi:hypothetical protein